MNEKCVPRRQPALLFGRMQRMDRYQDSHGARSRQMSLPSSIPWKNISSACRRPATIRTKPNISNTQRTRAMVIAAKKTSTRRSVVQIGEVTEVVMGLRKASQLRLGLFLVMPLTLRVSWRVDDSGGGVAMSFQHTGSKCRKQKTKTRTPRTTRPHHMAL